MRVLQMLGDRQRAALRGPAPSSSRPQIAIADALLLGRGGHVDRGLAEREACASGHAIFSTMSNAAAADLEGACGSALADVLAGEDRDPPRDESRVFAGIRASARPQYTAASGSEPRID